MGTCYLSHLCLVKAQASRRQRTVSPHGRIHRGTRGSGPQPKENHKLLHVRIEILIRIPSRSNWPRVEIRTALCDIHF